LFVVVDTIPPKKQRPRNIYRDNLEQFEIFFLCTRKVAATILRRWFQYVIWGSFPSGLKNIYMPSTCTIYFELLFPHDWENSPPCLRHVLFIDCTRLSYFPLHKTIKTYLTSIFSNNFKNLVFTHIRVFLVVSCRWTRSFAERYVAFSTNPT
jgi:hypothetical protein